MDTIEDFAAVPFTCALAAAFGFGETTEELADLLNKELTIVDDEEFVSEVLLAEEEDEEYPLEMLLDALEDTDGLLYLLLEYRSWLLNSSVAVKLAL